MCDDIVERFLPHIFLPRQKHIVAPLQPSINGKTVVEIGCGNARTISRLMPPSKCHYDYVGTDIAFWRLVVAKTVCPEGEFIQASAFNLPIASQIADVGISFGMLHHLPRPVDGLVDLHRTLKPGAMLAIHEPVATAKIITGRFKRIEASLQTYEHSEHDGEINLKEFEHALEKLGYLIQRREFLASPFRTAAERVVLTFSKSLARSKILYGLLFTMDKICIKSICHISKLLSPRGVIMLAKCR